MKQDQPSGSNVSRQFAHHRHGVGLKKQHISPDDGVEWAIESHLRRVALSEGHVVQSSHLGAVHRRGDCRRRRIGADHFARRADEFGSEESHISGAAADVEDAHTGGNPGIAQELSRDGIDELRLRLEAR
jgi:hypothetical protein